MAGVNPPNNERLLQLLGDLDSRLRAVETQQQQTITDSQGRPVINFGLIPGSNPARYGMQFVDPNNAGAEELFIGENPGSSYGVVLTVGSSGVIESANFVHGVQGFQLLPNGNAEFNQLTLLDGIIGDAALTNPVMPASFDTTQASLTWSSGTFADYATSTVSVPSGFTTAAVLAAASAGTTVPSGGGSLSVLPNINGTLASQSAGWAESTTAAGSIMALYSVVLTGVSGSITIKAHAAGTNGTSGSGWARTSGYVLFLR